MANQLDPLQAVVLTTCTNGRDTTWDTARARGYTLTPKPYVAPMPELLRPPSWATIALRAWRARHEHDRLIAAFRAERSKALDDTRRENKRRQANTDSAQRRWQEQRDELVTCSEGAIADQDGYITISYLPYISRPTSTGALQMRRFSRCVCFSVVKHKTCRCSCRAGTT